VRPRREHEQPGAVPGRDPGRSQRPVQGGQKLRGPAGQHAALRQRPVQVNEEIRVDDMHQRVVRHLLRPGHIADAVESVSEPAHQSVMLGRASRGARDGLAQEFGRDPGGPADQELCRASQPAQYPLIHRLGLATGSVN
jgi:hypothetical protein